jgi:hypothetical protein
VPTKEAEGGVDGQTGGLHRITYTSPFEYQLPTIAAETALSKSASANTSNGLFPPASVCARELGEG